MAPRKDRYEVPAWRVKSIRDMKKDIVEAPKCSWKFSHLGRPREECGLPAGPDTLCVFHSDQPVPNFEQLLEQEVANPQHWLEGAKIKQDLHGLRLVGAKLPKANFEGRKLTDVVLTNALLEEANFRSAFLEGILLYGSNLSRAIFDLATLRGIGSSHVDLRNTELGGASFTSSTLKSLRLLGVRFSAATRITPLLDTPCFEMENGLWDDAAAVYATLGKRAADDLDFASADLCSYLSMTCRHRKVIKVGPLPKRYRMLNWAMVSFRAGPVGWLWLVHRAIWGYGLRPLRTLFAMLGVVVLFWLIFFFIKGEPSGSSLVDTLILSLTTFVPLEGYNERTPSSAVAEFVGSVETFLGIILLDLFLVALACKYVRRF